MVFTKIFFLVIILLGTVSSGKCNEIDNMMENDAPDILNFTVKRPVDPKIIIQRYGYPAECHRIVTEDGYVLMIHRIPRGIQNKKKKSPVLIMHGLGSSSADFVNMGPKESLGYILADKGYDVWLGNARGNSYSNKHISVNAKLHPEVFYNFSWHEIGTIDVPAKIDYILKVTNRTKLHYIGHSQGGTVLYVMTSFKPEYNEKIRLASLMAPAGFVANVPEPVLKFLSRFTTDIQYVLENLGIYHLPFLDLTRSFLENLCKYESYVALCREIFYIFSGGYPDNTKFNKSIFPRIFQTTPSDAAIKQFIHYFQEIKSGKFQHFDYGPVKNRKIYGTLHPSEYNLTTVTAPIALYYANNDRFIAVKDIHRTATRLSRVVRTYLVPYEKFNHGDFLFANDARPLIYNELLRVMEFY